MSESYAQIVDGLVVNVIVLKDPADVQLDGDLIALADHHEGRWGIGWSWDGSKPIPPIPDPALYVDGVPSADGQTPATARIAWPEHPNFTPPNEVVFILNGAPSNPVPVANRAAELEFTASGPGAIVVQAAGQEETVVVP